ncbi:hypothetical protein [uncultured Paracoccus sp.]|uniref:hypothetical protein n=1 Tax=uncultured Paracoccus sp. TaxID=189685 RepID=UPI0026133FE6|nr:hypothetical protein [uncultured Paracoccus sp.]
MIGIEFTRLNEGECLLCGASRLLTGEHKIKASLLKEEFGNRPAIISGKDRPRILQSPRSKHAHFNAGICENCNTSGTQAADRAFDQLHRGLKQLRMDGLALTDENGQSMCRLPSNVTLNSFRYFAKLLCCFLAEVGGPRSRSLSAFALGLSHHNPIFLKISQVQNYEAALRELDTQGFAQHGGLKFRFDDQKQCVTSLESSLSAGGIHYDFWVQLRWLPRLELNLGFADLVRNARRNID